MHSFHEVRAEHTRENPEENMQHFKVFNACAQLILSMKNNWKQSARISEDACICAVQQSS